jgi:phenylacetaldehyde dehydrogenase
MTNTRKLPDSWPSKMLIGGSWQGARHERMSEITDPTTERVIGRVPEGDAEDVSRAVAAARTTFDRGDWIRIAPGERAKILWRAADLIEREVEAIAAAETLNNGMLHAMAVGTVLIGAEAFRYYAGAITKIHGLTSEISAGPNDFHAYTMREPVGVAGLITPWNGPFALASFKVATALAAGCSCVLKPAEETPFTALKLGQLLNEAGLPPGVLNIVTGRGETAGAALVAHRDVDKISFTGSTEVGKHIVREASHNLKKLSLELGGKSPVIIFDDADVEAAIAGAAMGVFINAGQVCMAGSRVFVQRGIYERVVAGFAAAAQAIKLGSGFEPDVGMGPLISAKQQARVLELIAQGTRDGARLIVGGHRHGGNGFFVSPTVLADVPRASRLMSEEVFGPVVALVPFDHFEEAAALANDTDYGLAAAIWTRDINKAHLLAKKIRAGILWINCQMASDLSLPYGGYKQSGWGRETGLEGLDPFLQTKTVYAKLHLGEQNFAH